MELVNADGRMIVPGAAAPGELRAQQAMMIADVL